MNAYLREFAIPRRLELSNGRPSAVSCYSRPTWMSIRADCDYRPVSALACMLDLPTLPRLDRSTERGRVMS